MTCTSKNIINQAFVYFYLTHPKTVEWLAVLAESRSGTFPQITFDQLIDLKINTPSAERLREAEEWCETTLYKIKKNNKQIRTLTQTRDTLAPSCSGCARRLRWHPERASPCDTTGIAVALILRRRPRTRPRWFRPRKQGEGDARSSPNSSAPRPRMRSW